MKRSAFTSIADRFGIGSVGFEVSLNRPAARVAIALMTLSSFSLLLFAILSNFIVGALTDERVAVSAVTLATASRCYPASPRLHARLAEMSQQERDPAIAEESALRAVKLSPHNFNYRLLLAAIKESRGALMEAEQSLRAALALAPSKPEVHWQMANLLLRERNPGGAAEEFRAASALNAKLLPVSLNLIWRSSGGSLEAVETVAGSAPGARLALAQFLLKQGSLDDAARVFSQLGSRARIESSEAGLFLDALIAAGRFRLARDLWRGSSGNPIQEQALISNGSFESEIPTHFAQFDWVTYDNQYAEIHIGMGVTRTGVRSLRIDFLGRDTARLDGEIKQRIVVQAGARYRLECYAKADKLDSPEGPRVVVTTGASPDWIAASEPVGAGKQGWQRIAFELTAPSTLNGEAPELFVGIKRKPKFSYDAPTRGTVYFDDFMLTELAAAAGQIVSRGQR